MDKETKELLENLQNACKSGNDKDLSNMLQSPNINNVINRRSGKLKRAPLHTACEGGHNECVEILLQNPGILVDIEDARKWTTLQLASDLGYLHIVKVLLKHHADPWHSAENGNTSCHNAAMHGFSKVVETLLDKQPKLVDSQNIHKWTPLHLCCVDGHLETVKILLKFKANTDIKTYLGDTACNLAARNNFVEVMKVIKNTGADLEIGNQNDETPLLTSSLCGKEETTEYLLQNGVDPFAKTKSGMTGIHFAAKNGYNKIITIYEQCLDDIKALINSQTEQANTVWVSTMGCGLHLPNVTPLHLAVLEAKPEAVKSLILCGAEREIPDGNGRTPMDLLENYFNKYQVWDKENVEAVKEVLEKWTMPNLACGGRREVADHYEDSDYQSTCTSEDIAESLHELEGSVKSLKSISSSKKAKRGLERLRKEQNQLDGLLKQTDSISEVDKSKLNMKMKDLEGKIQHLLTIMEERHATSYSNEKENGAKGGENSHSSELVKKFRANFTKLQDELNADEHMHFLFQEEVLESSDIEKLINETNEKTKVVKMLYILWGKKNTDWIVTFLRSLANNDGSKHLLDLFD